MHKCSNAKKAFSQMDWRLRQGGFFGSLGPFGIYGRAAMERLICSAAWLFFGLFGASSSAAMGLERFSGLGYLGYQTAEFESDIDGGGLVLGGEISSPLTRVGPATVVGGLGLERGNMKGDRNSLEIETNVTAIGGFGGFRFPANPRLDIETLIHYDIGISGEGRISVGGSSRTEDLNSMQRLTHEWRAMFESSKTMMVGFGLRWFRGEIKLDDFTDDFDFKGYSLNGMMQFQL
jgi:hypothetical protein